VTGDQIVLLAADPYAVPALYAYAAAAHADGNTELAEFMVSIAYEWKKRHDSQPG